MRKPITFHPIVILAAVIVLAIVLPLAWQRWYQPPETQQQEDELVTYVDRGFTEEALENKMQQIEQLETKIAEAEAAGEPAYDSRLLLANAYYSLGELGTAVEMYDALLADLPGDPAALENKAQAVLEMGDPEQAVDLWKQALERNPGYQITYFKIANAIQKHLPERNEEAREILEQGVEVIGQTEGLMVALGEWYRSQQMYDQAISHYQNAVRISPDDEAIKRELEEIRQERARHMERNTEK